MPEDDLPDRMVLRPSLLKWSILLVIGLGTVGVSAQMLGEGSRPEAGWFVLAFGSLCSLVSALAMPPGGNGLTLERDAFMVRQFYVRSWRFRWVDVGPFSVATPNNHAMVVFDEPARRGAGIHRMITGVSSFLPDTYGLGPQELADLLERWRRRARRDAGLPA